MPPTSTIILIQLSLFLAAMTQTTFGFGSAIVAMPLLLLMISPSTATPLVALIGIILSASIAISSWRSIDWKATWRILLASTIAAPLGVLLLLYAEEDLIKAILGWMLVLYGIYCLLPFDFIHLKNDNWAFPFGFLGGVLGSAFNINGPPVLIYGTLRHWPPAEFRASLSGYFLPSGIIVALSHFAGGLWTPEVWKFFLISLPGTAVAVWLGSRLNKRIDPARFKTTLYFLIIGMGIMMLVL